MISTINEAAVALGRLVELSILGKATIILMIGLTIVMLSGRARASVRHLLLAATLAAVFALPLLVVAVPEVIIGIPAAQASESTDSSDFRTATPSVALTAPTSISLPSRTPESAPWSLPSWLTIVRTVWLAGVFLLLALLAVDLRRLYRIRRDTGRPALVRTARVSAVVGQRMWHSSQRRGLAARWHLGASNMRRLATRHLAAL
ncbi:MAG: hypothetical protein ACRD9Y_10605 [Blastocatellia bacterium]